MSRVQHLEAPGASFADDHDGPGEPKPGARAPAGSTRDASDVTAAGALSPNLRPFNEGSTPTPPPQPPSCVRHKLVQSDEILRVRSSRSHAGQGGSPQLILEGQLSPYPNALAASSGPGRSAAANGSLSASGDNVATATPHALGASAVVSPNRVAAAAGSLPAMVTAFSEVQLSHQESTADCDCVERFIAAGETMKRAYGKGLG